MRKIFLSLLALFFLSESTLVYAAEPSSASYKIDGYSFGAGGTTNGTNSTNFKLFGTSGEVESGRPTSTNFKSGGGLTYLINNNVPGAPTVSNPGNTYDRLQVVLSTSSNATDTTYAIQLSTVSNFASNIQYVKAGNTIGSTLTSSDYQTYTTWGGASGFFVTGLAKSTTYYFRVIARQGVYSETEYGPSASAATANPTISFTLSSSSVTFSPLNGGNAYTDSAKNTILTTSTNAYNGYTVYAKETQSLTSLGGSTIADYASPNSAPTVWSGTGFGYNTSDTVLSGGTSNRFSGSKYAGFTTSSITPGDPVADDPGPVQSAQISGETFTISYRITASNITPAATYSNVIVYTILPSY